MDWDEDCFLSASQEQALQALERRGGACSGGAAVAAALPPGPVSAAQPAAAAQPATAPPPAAAPAPVVRRRKLPAILSDAPLAGAGTAAAGAPAAAAVGDENLPPARFAGRLRYAHTGYEVDTLCRQLLQSGVTAVGLDIEWRVLYQTGVPPRPVALIQICSNEGARAPPGSSAATSGPGAGAGYTCLLLHICHSGITPHLRQLLTSPVVLKVGVGIHGDLLKIQRDFGIEMQGTVCLSECANARLVAPPPAPAGPAAGGQAVVGGSGNGSDSCGASSSGAVLAAPSAPAAACGGVQYVAHPQKWSLAGLASLLLRLRLEKSQAVRCSNWEARPPLSGEQQAYAATDAWASLRVYEVLAKLPVVAPPPLPPPPAGAAVQQCSAATGASDMASAADWVPACISLRHVQPAKLAVYQALVQQGLSVQAVAAQRRIQEDSVQGYMAEAMTAGLGYSWSCLGVPAPVLRQVADVASQLLGRPLAWQPQPGGQLAQQQQQQCQVGSKRPPPCSPGSLAAAAAAHEPGGAAVAPAAGEAAAEAAAEAAPGGGSSSSGEPVDMLEQLLAAGHKVRKLKEAHFPETSYGWLRLALAHLGRCNPGPWQ